MPPALIFTSALTCGVLAALALRIYLSQAGFDFAALWQNLLGAGARQLRTTGPWWAIAGLAFVTGGIVAAALSRLPPPWRRHRPLRWTAGALLVLLLAHIGHSDTVRYGRPRRQRGGRAGGARYRSAICGVWGLSRDAALAGPPCCGDFLQSEIESLVQSSQL